MKVKKVLIVFCIFLGFIILNNKVYAGTQKWNSLDYDVTVNSDGSMDVIETWNVRISETNTLFKDFELDSSKFGGIENVEVYKVDETGETLLREIYEQQYHVDSGCYYGLQLYDDTFEIAWNVGLDNSSGTRVYKICYTVIDAVKIYNDCTEIYWQFLSAENGMSGKNVTGLIKLPQEVKDIEHLRVWAHGDLSGEIYKASNNSVVFSLPSIPSNTMLEVRVVTEENIYENSYNYNNYNKLNNILAEEQKWADEANAKRESYKRFITIIKVVNIICFVFFSIKAIKYIKKIKEVKEKYSFPKSDLKYYRDIPEEEMATPVRAAYLYYFKNRKSSLEYYKPKIFTATILDLTLKKALKLEPIDKKNVKIIINNCDLDLSRDEEIILNLIKKASTNGETTTKNFEKYYKIHYDNFYNNMDKLVENVEEYAKKEEFIDKEKEKIANSMNAKFWLYFILIIFSLCFCPIIAILPIMFIGLIVCCILCAIINKKINVLTEKGNNQKNEWIGLKNYMDDFSLLKEKEVPDLVLWEKYLVYATTFGISKKVIEQLKIVYPQIMDQNTYYDNRYTYMYLACNNNFGNNFMESLDNSFGRVYNTATSAYNSAHSSSGSGGGGGFSGGGGGGRRRWKLRRSLITNYIIDLNKKSYV